MKKKVSKKKKMLRIRKWEIIRIRNKNVIMRLNNLINILLLFFLFFTYKKENN